MELWVKKKFKKHSSVVESHLPTWMYRFYSKAIRSAFSPTDQKVDIETNWNDDTPLDREEAEAQSILDVDVNCIVDCDEISLVTARSEFVAVEDCYLVGALFSRTSRVGFIPDTEVIFFDTTKSSASLPRNDNTSNDFTKVTEATCVEHIQPLSFPQANAVYLIDLLSPDSE